MHLFVVVFFISNYSYISQKLEIMTRIHQFITLAVVSTLAIFTFFAFTGCSNSKQVQKTEYIYTERIDSVIVNGKTAIIITAVLTGGIAFKDATKYKK